ncbi:MAG: ribonuclease P protein component [Clostridia bacterium]|nr:ribonuclease P protein component [Clostridia bacterium]MBQ2737825.1 ribonuclease P protein component [Clostridia bacterium]MBQ8290609.1 ribonuclease P protein component [Clostridia bacterium]
MKFRRVKENHLFQKAYKRGKRAVTSALAVYTLPDYAAKRLQKADTRGRLKNRYGITVSVKIGGAVTRSRCRRIIRAALYEIEKRGNLKQGFLIVISARSILPTKKSTEIVGELSRALDTLGLITK